MAKFSEGALVAAGFGFAAFLVMAADTAYLRKFFFLTAYKNTFTALLRCSGFFALFHALAALVPESAVFFTNVASVCKVAWVYNYLCLLLTNFNPHGHGGMRENIDQAGKILERAKFPPLRTKPWCIPFVGSFTYTPDTEWLERCVSRVRYYLWSEVATVIVTQVLDDQNLLFKDDGTPNIALKLVNLVGILFLLSGVSGFMSMRRLLLPLVLPDKRHHVLARAILCSVFFTWIGGIQNVVMSLLNFHQNTRYAIINVEMLILQICSHKYYVPMFVWGYTPPEFVSLENSKQVLSDYKFLIPVEDMAATALRDSVSSKKAENSSYELTVTDIEKDGKSECL